jgi:hypothetical protein
MRFILAITALCVVTVSCACGEEAYESTANELAACIGREMKPLLTPGSRIISPDAVDALLKQKCGYLEEQQEKEFIDYINRQLNRSLTDKERTLTAMSVAAELLNSHTRGGLRRMSVEAYKSAATKRK